MKKTKEPFENMNKKLASINFPDMTYEVLIYSGNKPKSLKDKPEGTLIAKFIPNSNSVHIYESGSASYSILLINGSPCCFGSVEPCNSETVECFKGIESKIAKKL